MKTIFYIIALVFLTMVMILFVNTSHSVGTRNDQYCDVEPTKIRVVDQSGKVIEERTEGKVTCNDGAMDFLHGMGIADSCQVYTWWLPIGGTVVRQRDIACHKMEGGYESGQGYHTIE